MSFNQGARGKQHRGCTLQPVEYKLYQFILVMVKNPWIIMEWVHTDFIFDRKINSKFFRKKLYYNRLPKNKVHMNLL